MNPLSKFLVGAYSEAAFTSAAGLTEDIRSSALEMGWPEEVANHLIVDLEDGQYIVKYPQMLKDSILTLEYGTQAIPPLPAIRSFIQGLYDTDMEQEVEKHLKKSGLVF